MKNKMLTIVILVILSLSTYVSGSGFKNAAWAAPLSQFQKPLLSTTSKFPTTPPTTSKFPTTPPTTPPTTSLVIKPGMTLAPQLAKIRIDTRTMTKNYITRPQTSAAAPLTSNQPVSSDLGHVRGCKALSDYLPGMVGYDLQGDNHENYLIAFNDLVPGVSFPEWVSADPSDKPYIATGIVTDAGLSTSDYPFAHDSHDIDFAVKLDPNYNGLLSDHNPTSAGIPVLGVEWESKYFGYGYWPSEGDRFWAMGRWIFDCGHPPYSTEMHPPQAIALSHFQPVIFPGHTGPSDATRTYIYIHGKGGYYDTPVGGRDYAFDIVLPPKPKLATGPFGGVASIQTQISGVLGGPSPILTPMPTANPPAVHVVYPLSSVPASVKNEFGATVDAGWVVHQANTLLPGRQLDYGYTEVQVTLDSITILHSTHGHDCQNPDNRIMLADVNGKYKQLYVSGTGAPLLRGCDGQTIDLNVPFPPMIVKDSNGNVTIHTSGYEREFASDCAFGVCLQQAADDWLGCGSPISDCGIALPTMKDDNFICSIDVVHSIADNFGVGTHSTPEVRDHRTGATCPDSDASLNYHIDELKKFTTDTVQGPVNTAHPSQSSLPLQTQSFQALPSPATNTTTPNQTQSFNAVPPPTTTTSVPNQTQSFNATTPNQTRSFNAVPSGPAPVAQDQPDVKTSQKTPVVITFHAMDPNPNANLQAQIVSQPKHGKLGNVDQAAGKVTYTSNPDYTGNDSFTFKVNNGKIDSNAATVKIAIQTSNSTTGPNLVTTAPTTASNGNSTLSNNIIIPNSRNNTGPLPGR
jgi:hypothetical protein